MKKEIIKVYLPFLLILLVLTVLAGCRSGEKNGASAEDLIGVMPDYQLFYMALPAGEILREGPGKNQKEIRKLDFKEMVYVLPGKDTSKGENREWVRVICEGLTGWLPYSALSSSEPVRPLSAAENQLTAAAWDFEMETMEFFRDRRIQTYYPYMGDMYYENQYVDEAGIKGGDNYAGESEEDVYIEENGKQPGRDGYWSYNEQLKLLSISFSGQEETSYYRIISFSEERLELFDINYAYKITWYKSSLDDNEGP